VTTGYSVDACARAVDICPEEEQPDIEQLKSAFGRLPAGVAVVTSALPDGEFVGATVSSFTSLSFDPPLVVLGLAEQSKTLAAILGRGHFGVHIVAAPQRDLAMRFASKSPDKFASVSHEVSRYGVPILTEFETRLECALEHAQPAGDHQLLIGRVRDVVVCKQNTSAAVWFQRAFHLIDPASAA
jgi:3-hydroxy-9,10-secoandrosta-1,3,5(10)-triene-9,17-dione monooxygenase reductase component